MSANTTPDATGTHRTDDGPSGNAPAVVAARRIACLASNGRGISVAEALAYIEAEFAPKERELTAAKAQLRERTQWMCKCGGTDCAGQAENERLRAEVERYRERERLCETIGQAEKLALIRALQEIRDASGLLGDGVSPCEIVEAVKELRARVAELEQRLTWARKNCRVIYHPPDNAYPVEHAPHANKDQWEALAVYADQDAKGAT